MAKKVNMPKSIKSKLLGAISMLTVGAIMLVSSTYAWFTLSTAPEVTGISTSVGANGNLEIALLNDSTYADLSTIASGTGDSMDAAGKDATSANITWGNLVDLSNATYGLNGIKLMPASANIKGDGTLDTAKFLNTAVYGKDGRVKELQANTVSAIKGEDGFKVGSTQSYGVRAVGVSSNITANYQVFAAARSNFTSAKNNVTAPIVRATAENKTAFATIATAGEKENYTDTEVAAMKAMAIAAQTSLNNIVKAYANAALAAAASGGTLEDAAILALETSLANKTDAAGLKAALSGTTGVYNDVLDTLAGAQTSVAGVITACEQKLAGESVNVKDDIVAPLLGGSGDIIAYTAGNVTTALTTENLANIKKVYLGGGVLKTITDQVGNIYLTELLADIYAGTMDSTANALNVVAGTVSALPAPTGDDNNAIISDTYGYVIDFAFRTNAASSNLQLQTAAKNRVYSSENGEELATQGAGSNVTYTYDNGLTSDQAKTLLSAIKFVFFDPVEGTVYAQGKLNNIVAGADKATADVVLEGDDNNVTITALEQNVAKKVSVLVYLDGTKVDNTAVVNGSTSGSLSVNLQFSSSAELTPMENTALKTMSK